MHPLLYVAKAIAEPKRLRVIAALREQELCVCELCDGLKLRQSTLSSHLHFLLQAAIVEKRLDGKWVYYSLRSGFRPVLEALFKFYRTELENDRELLADASRLEKRLALREEGNCCKGFTAPKTKVPNSKKHVHQKTIR